jgi:hypothetical protein
MKCQSPIAASLQPTVMYTSTSYNVGFTKYSCKVKNQKHLFELYLLTGCPRRVIGNFAPAMKVVKLNTTGIKFTPSSFITYYEVNTNFSVTDESELLTLDEVKAVLNAYQPQVKRSQNAWCIAVTVPLKDLKRAR